jgi:hypothetical protein
MKKIGLGVLLIAVLAVTGVLIGCKGRQSGSGKVNVLNFKPEIDQQWQELASQ